MHAVIAHLSKDGSEQLLVDHLKQTANLAGKFGETIALAHTAKVAGLLHDIGKKSDAFQSYIRDENGRRGSVSHAPYGAIIIYDLYHEKYPLASEIIANAIYTHHNAHGELDYITSDFQEEFINRINEKKKQLEDLESVKNWLFNSVVSKKDLTKIMDTSENEINELTETYKDSHEKFQQILFYINRFVYSCLIDADRSNTIAFELSKDNETVDYHKYFEDKYAAFTKNIEEFKNDTPLNKLRSEISEKLDICGSDPDGIHQLSVPTGGGKTLASLRYSLKKCIANGKKRIIFVIPYTSIIEQNAQVIRNIIDEAPNDTYKVLEHHSNISAYDDETERLRRSELAQTNWDEPIIITTMVQFANTVWAGKTTMTRRFNHLANSVIVFDEIQSIPDEFLTLFTQSIFWLNKIGKADIVLCTATQPPLDDINADLTINQLITGLFDKKEFDRVDIVNDAKKYIQDENELSEYVLDKTKSHRSILVIATTKAVVAKTFKVLNDKVNEDTLVYHLSTSMAGAHRKKVIAEMKTMLKEKKKVVCITTPLIEAGVDVSFESVIRSLSGLDSIAQAAGRCNRNNEAKDKKGKVYLVRLAKSFEKLGSLKTVERRASESDKLLTSMISPNDLLNEKVIKKYFEGYYAKTKKDFDLQGVGLTTYTSGIESAIRYVRNNNAIPKTKQFFASRTVGKNVKVISQDTVGLIVPYDDAAKDIISKLSSEKLDINILKELLQKAQIYTVNVYRDTLKKYAQAIYELHAVEGVFAVRNQYYDENLGLCVEPIAQMDEYIF